MGGSAVSAGLNHSPWPPGITDLNKRPGVSLSSLGVTTLTASCPTTRPLCTALPPPRGGGAGGAAEGPRAVEDVGDPHDPEVAQLRAVRPPLHLTKGGSRMVEWRDREGKRGGVWD